MHAHCPVLPQVDEKKGMISEMIITMLITTMKLMGMLSE